MCGFSATASDIDGSVASYSWDFGDGSTGVGSAPSHTYAAEGPYTVTLTVTDDAGGQTAVASGLVTGHPNSPPTAAFTTNITNTSVVFDGTASHDSDGSIVSYNWDFGDGSTATGATPTHDFGVTGDFLVTLTVTDDLGASTSTTQLVSVSTPNQLPVASFTFTSAGRTLSFDGTSSYDPDGQIVQYSWDFGDGSPPDTGDGSAGSGSLTSHTFALGTYTVTLTVTDDRGGTNSTSQTVTI
jgi:PKD repeat protein